MTDSAFTTGSYNEKDCSRYKVLINFFLYPMALKHFFSKAMAIDNNQRILDAGCGYGTLSEAVAAKVSKERLTGIEQHAFDLSRAMLRAFKHAGGDAIHLLQSDVRAMPYQDDSFDLIVTSAMLEYVPDVEVALAMLKKCLKPGGRVIIFISRRTPLNTLLFLPFGKPRCYRYAEVERLLAAAGFREIRQRSFPLLFFALNLWGMIIEAVKERPT